MQVCWYHEKATKKKATKKRNKKSSKERAKLSRGTIIRSVSIIIYLSWTHKFARARYHKKGIYTHLSFMDTKGARYHRLEKGVRGVIIGEKNVLFFFHVSEHIDHFKAIKKFCEKTGNSLVWGYLPPPLFGKKPNYFRFFHLTASLMVNLDRIFQNYMNSTYKYVLPH